MSPPTADPALLSFFLGPVQPFIEAAKTTRDLWAGSYLLSWLTFAAMKPVIDGCGEGAFVTPSVAGNPLLTRTGHARRPPVELTTAGLPNKFLARVPADAVAGLAAACEQACREAWMSACAAVKSAVDAKLATHRSQFLSRKQIDLVPGWDRDWPEQVANYFEVRTVWLREADLTAERLAVLFADPPGGPAAALTAVNGLMDARKAVRHVPAYRPRSGATAAAGPEYPQKCSVLGSFEQLGPAGLDDSAAFWKAFARHVSVGGTRVRSGERLCAVAVVKRFAWAAHLRVQLGNLDPRVLRYSDTATVAAKLWLKQADIDPGDYWDEFDEWSGQWLHWAKPDQDQDEPCPPKAWAALSPRVRAADTSPPTYYALLVADGDRLGKILTQSTDAESRAVTTALTGYATNAVRGVIEADDVAGEVVYAGGDDVIALLPAAAAVEATGRLNARYGELWGRPPVARFRDLATLSAGLVVVHYKEDLRFALQQARAAEKAAKAADRNKLALTVCRRSGEHTTVVLTWDQAKLLEAITRAFLGDDGASVRWTYKLREELPVLEGLTADAVRGEVGRLLGRLEWAGSDAAATRFKEDVQKLFDSLCGAHCRRIDAATLGAFVTACQSAAFLARGRDR